MSKTGGGPGTNQYSVKGKSIKARPKLVPPSMEELSSHELYILAQNSHFREAYARRGDYSPRMFCKLAKDPSVNVRRGVAKNLSCSSEALMILAQDPDIMVRRAIARHPNLLPATVAQLATDTDFLVSMAARSHQNLPDHLHIITNI